MGDDAEPIERTAWLPYRAGYAIRHAVVEVERHGQWCAGERPAAELEAYAQRMGWDRDPELMELMRRGLRRPGAAAARVLTLITAARHRRRPPGQGPSAAARRTVLNGGKGSINLVRRLQPMA